MAYHLGPQPDWDDVLKCGCLKNTASLRTRKNSDGTYHVYPSSSGAPPQHLWFPPGAMVGSGPIVNMYDVMETIILSVCGGFYLGALHFFLAIQRALSKRSLGSFDYALYVICVLLLSPLANAATGSDSGKNQDMGGTSDPDQTNGNVYDDYDGDGYGYDDDEGYVPPIFFKDIDDEFIVRMELGLPDHMLCIMDDDFRHRVLTVRTNRSTLKKYLTNRCTQLGYTPNDMWLGQSITYDKKLQKLKSDDYSQLMQEAAETANDGAKEAIKLATGFVKAAGAIIGSTSKDAIRVMSDNNDVVSESVLRVKDWTDKVVQASPDVSDMIGAGITMVNEAKVFADTLTSEIRSGQQAAEFAKSSVKNVLDDATAIRETAYDSTRNVVRQVYHDAWSSDELSKWTRESAKELIEISKTSPSDFIKWAQGQEYKKTFVETIEGVPWLTRTLGESVAAPIHGAAKELQEVDEAWFLPHAIAKVKLALIGKSTEFAAYKKKTPLGEEKYFGLDFS